jgi:predicted transcriptional regulator
MKNVSIDEILAAVDGELVCKGEYDTVKWAIASGLMSDVLTTEIEDVLLVSSLSTSQLVRTADMVGAHAILVACGKPIWDDAVQLAKDLKITLLRTNQPVFEVCYHLGKLFVDG